MKLYAMLKNERGGKKGTGDDTRIQLELSYGNKNIGILSFYAIEKNLGYRILWDNGSGYPFQTIEEEEKGEKQKGERTPENIAKWLNNGEHDKLQEQDYIKD